MLASAHVSSAARFSSASLSCSRPHSLCSADFITNIAESRFSARTSYGSSNGTRSVHHLRNGSATECGAIEIPAALGRACKIGRHGSRGRLYLAGATPLTGGLWATAEPIRFSTNIELVTKYYDKLEVTTIAISDDDGRLASSVGRTISEAK